MQGAVFTIGHSNHTQERFAELLIQHAITALCDVRSSPYSRFNPQFNREELNRSLGRRAIKYVFLGDELGARSEDPSCYEDGRAQYDLLARAASFRHGLERVREGMKSHRVALMCAEGEPLECHRAILIARHLNHLGVEVEHIHADGHAEGHRDALRRLTRMFDLREDELHMFRSHDELLADAYRLQETRIAYRAESDASGDVEIHRGLLG